MVKTSKFSLLWIFLITAVLYIIGVFLYAVIIKQFENMEKEKKSKVISVPEELKID